MRPNVLRFLPFVLISLIAFVARWFDLLPSPTHFLQLGTGDVLRVVAVVYLSYLLIVFVHELGHAVVGTLCGLELTRFVVGPFMIDFGADRPRIGSNPFRGYLDGAAEFAPVDDPASRLREYIWMTAAGPIANLLLAALLLALSGAGVGAAWFDRPAHYVGLFSGLVGLLNFLPFRAGPVRTDGAQLLLLLRGGEPRARSFAAFQLYRHVLSPTPPRHYPPETVRQAERIVADWVRGGRVDDASAAWPAVSLLYYHYVDRGDRPLARELLELVVTAPRTKRQVRRGDFQLFDTLYAFHVALWDGDAAAARTALERVPRRAFVRTNSFWQGARAAVALAEGRHRDALAEAGRARRRLVRFGLRNGADHAEQLWLESLVARAEASERNPMPLGDGLAATADSAASSPRTVPAGD